METTMHAGWTLWARKPLRRGWRSFFTAWTWALLLALPWIEAGHAACNVGDIASAVVVSLETTAVCEPVCEDKYRCYAAAILGGALTVVANREGQDKVDFFCGNVQGKTNEVIGQVREVLTYQFVQDQLGEISGYLNQYAGDAQQVMAIVKCACATEKLNIKNQTSFGACANGLLHDVGCGSIDFKTGVIESCTPGGKIIQNFFDSSWDVLKSVGCGSGLTSWLFECKGNETAGPRFTDCYAGYQTDSNGKCHLCRDHAHALTLKSGRCGCEAAYTPAYYVRHNTPILIDCTCQPPYQRVGESCLCPVNQQLKEGACAPCADYEKYVPYRQESGTLRMPSCQPCELGYHQAKDDPTRCVPGWACDPKVGEVPDPNFNGKKCKQCSVRQRVVTGMPIYIHQCEPCAKGQKASSDHAQCVPECAPGWISNSAKGFVGIGVSSPACVKCAPGEHAVYEHAGSSLGSCETANYAAPVKPKLDHTLDAAKRRGDTWLNPQPEPPLPKLQCPPNTQPDAQGKTCVVLPRPPVLQRQTLPTR